MKLTRFIQTEMENLLEDWEEAVLEIAPELKGEDSLTLRDHAREMLEFIAQDLGECQTEKASALKALGHGNDSASVGGEHGTDRQKQGMSILQMVQELRALRARVIVSWGNQQKGLTTKDIDELVRFNEAIDQLITSSMSSFSALKDQETRLLEAVLRVSPDPEAIFAPDGRLLSLNTPMADLANTTVREAVGKTPFVLDLSFNKELYEAITATVTNGGIQRREFHHYLPSRRERYYDCQFVPVFDDRNAIEAIAIHSRDITEHKQAEYQAWRSANFDSLTGLPNRRLFLDRLEQSLLEAERKGSSFALLFLDLDRFKQANDQLGHKAGDQLLQQVAERIGTTVRAVDTAARLGGDEFTLILKETDRAGAKEVAKEIVTRLEQVFDIDSHRINISCSIGLTFFPDDGTTIDKLMHNADQAMYAAKTHQGQQVQFYEPRMAQSESEHMRLNRELDEAIRENQMEVYYQPIIDIRTGAVSKAEALLRWNHPDEGLLTPAAFLAIAEQSRIADGIHSFVLDQAVRCSLRWCNQQGEAFPININESPASFSTRPRVDQWKARMTESDFHDSQITMELTSSSLTNLRAAGFNPVKALGKAGLRLHLAVDDFGIEPFSILTLHEYQVDSIKVDRELIKKIGQDSDIDLILRAIVDMAHIMSVQVVAEGVETDEQLQFLSSIDCDYAQGFLFSRPVRQDDFEALLRRDRQKMRS